MSGRVLDEGGRPAADAVVKIEGVRRQVKVDAQGAFRLEDVAAGQP